MVGETNDGYVLNAIRTNSVIFGQRRTFVASLALFTLAHVLLLVLALQGILPRPLAALVVLLPIHLRWSLKTLAEGLDYASVRRLQARYRALYAVVGLVMVVALCGVPRAEGQPFAGKSYRTFQSLCCWTESLQGGLSRQRPMHQSRVRGSISIPSNAGEIR